MAIGSTLAAIYAHVFRKVNGGAYNLQLDKVTTRPGRPESARLQARLHSKFIPDSSVH